MRHPDRCIPRPEKTQVERRAQIVNLAPVISQPFGRGPSLPFARPLEQIAIMPGMTAPDRLQLATFAEFFERAGPRRRGRSAMTHYRSPLRRSDFLRPGWKRSPITASDGVWPCKPSDDRTGRLQAERTGEDRQATWYYASVGSAVRSSASSVATKSGAAAMPSAPPVSNWKRSSRRAPSSSTPSAAARTPPPARSPADALPVAEGRSTRSSPRRRSAAKCGLLPAPSRQTAERRRIAIGLAGLRRRKVDMAALGRPVHLQPAAARGWW